MVERTHGTIKRVLHQQQRVLKTESPSVRLARALFTINFLNCSYEGLNPPIVRHFGASSLFGVKERPQVMVRDPGSGGTEGPHDLVTWGRGYACVSTPTGPKWIPAKWAKLSHQQYRQNVPGLIRQFQLTRSQARAIVATCPKCQVQAMPSMEKAYLTLNPVMNPIQVVILLLLNSLAAAWIIPQLRQNVWVTLAQTLQQENICLSTASTENPMSTCLVGIPLQAGEFPAGLDTHRSNEIPEPNTFRPYKGHQQKSGMTVNPLEEWLPSLPKLSSSIALKQLNKLGCWLSKEVNATSTMISDLLTDEEAIRHATLQNRAAIDYLLLAHGHGCEDFEGKKVPVQAMSSQFFLENVVEDKIKFFIEA
ncbi:hypothetical protein DUI87_23782 [Hirundo rustica rustica]|uniref:Uncharacterized protein n=1 Tax=Hirundo rustica rustica TaxID=333673 RepID=A0A3M0JHJ6_HIRRU|nr:hypothetical protein DUI87_23782 [Hirundo rustica rustica]